MRSYKPAETPTSILVAGYILKLLIKFILVILVLLTSTSIKIK